MLLNFRRFSLLLLYAAAPALNSQQPTPVSNPAPADMMRAYAALGLNYPNQTNRPTLPAVSQGELKVFNKWFWSVLYYFICWKKYPISEIQASRESVGINVKGCYNAGNTQSSLQGLNLPGSQLNAAGGATGRQQMSSLNNPQMQLQSNAGPGIGGVPGALSTSGQDSPLSTMAIPNRPTKEWHQHVTQDLRNHLVHKL